jgi:hypothetical protein
MTIDTSWNFLPLPDFRISKVKVSAMLYRRGACTNSGCAVWYEHKVALKLETLLSYVPSSWRKD